MAVKENTTMQANMSAVTVRAIDFVSRFQRNWDALRDIMGISRPIRKQPGTMLYSRTASVTLQSGAVAEGDEIPYSLATVTETPYADITIEKYAKAVSIEAINKYGYDVAIEKTDDAFLNELQTNVMGRFYTYLTTTATEVQAESFQSALAKAKGSVVNEFQSLNLTASEVVGFANTLDVYDYLGAAPITVQSQFGFNYIRDFMGYRVVFLLPEEQIPRGSVIAVPVENIDLYYIDPSDSDFARAGLEYVTAGETNLIGLHIEGKYSHAVSETYALLGMVLFAEYTDGIVEAKFTSTTTP